MRWFASFIVTSIVVILATGVLWARDHSLLGVMFVSDLLTWALPEALVLWVRRFQIPLIFGLWALLRSVFQWTLAYSGSQIEGSPRQDRFLDRLSGGVFRLFHNPARWWLAPYLGLLTLGMGIVGAYIWVFDNTLITRSAWGVTALFVATLGAMMLSVDPVDQLTAPDDPDPELDPLLDVPDD